MYKYLLCNTSKLAFPSVTLILAFIARSGKYFWCEAELGCFGQEDLLLPSLMPESSKFYATIRPIVITLLNN